MPKWTGLLVALVIALGPGLVGVAAAHAAPVAEPPRSREVPPRDQWLADVRAAMDGSRDYVRERVATGDEMLAINFDIDNTVIATYYDGGGPILHMLRFARFLERHDVAMVFNTGRSGEIRARTRAELRKAGYPVTRLCMRRPGEALAHGKQRCRNRFIDAGFTLIANVGNRDTDFVGGGYERAYRLPSYDDALG